MSLAHNCSIPGSSHCFIHQIAHVVSKVFMTEEDVSSRPCLGKVQDINGKWDYGK